MNNCELLKKIRIVSVLFFIVTFLALAAGKARAANVFAGVGNDGYFRDVQGLYAALEDVPGWSGVTAEYIHKNLSGSEIENSIISLQTILRPDDTLIWFYSGHGGAINDSNGDETVSGSFAADDFDETVGLVKQTDQLSDDDLGQAFLMLAATTGSQIITIFDTCYAGGFIGGVSDLNNVPGLVFLGASAEEEYSYSFTDQPHSIFTQGLIDGLTDFQADFDKNGILLAAEWFNFANDYTLNKVNNQHPVFWGNENMAINNSPVVPLPGSLWMLGIGVVSLLMVRRNGLSP